MAKTRNPKLLLDTDDKLVCLMDLAVLIGDREAMALQQIHYWCDYNAKDSKSEKRKTHYFPAEGETEPRWWVYNTVTEWQENNFRCWSHRTIQRVFERLEQVGVVYKQAHKDRNKGNWYAVNYDRLYSLLETVNEDLRGSRQSDTTSESGEWSRQNGVMGHDKMAGQSRQNDQPTGNTETTGDYSETYSAPESARARVSEDSDQSIGDDVPNPTTKNHRDMDDHEATASGGAEPSLLERVIADNFMPLQVPLSEKNRKLLEETFEIRLTDGDFEMLNLAQLYADDEEDFRTFVEVKLNYYKQLIQGGRRIPANQVVNSLRNVLDERYGWIAWRAQWRKDHPSQSKAKPKPVKVNYTDVSGHPAFRDYEFY